MEHFRLALLLFFIGALGLWLFITHLSDRRRGKQLNGFRPTQAKAALELRAKLGLISPFWMAMRVMADKFLSWLHIFVIMPITVIYAILNNLGLPVIAWLVGAMVILSWFFRNKINADSSAAVEQNLPIRVRNDWFYWMGVAFINLPRLYPFYLFFYVVTT